MKKLTAIGQATNPKNWIPPKKSGIATHPLLIGGILLLAGIICWIIHFLKN